MSQSLNNFCLLGDFATDTSLENIFSSWSGFVKLYPPSEATGLGAWYDLDGAPDAHWQRSGGIERKTIPALGCYFQENIELCGDGYLFKDGQFLREQTHTADAAFARYQDPTCHTNPVNMPRTNRVEVDRPALWVCGPGENVYGHWLLDFLPRVMIARRVLGPHFDDFVIVLSSNTPGWALRMLKEYCGVAEAQIRFYDAFQDCLAISRACIPTYAHDGNYALHGSMRDFYRNLGNSYTPPSRRICITRSGHGGREFTSRATFERLAVEHQFEIVAPETLSFTEQAKLYGSATCLIGEHGSALHGSVFSAPGTLVGSIGFNWVQCHVAASCSQRLLFLRRMSESDHLPDGTPRFGVAEADLQSMFDLIEQLLAEPTV